MFCFGLRGFSVWFLAWRWVTPCVAGQERLPFRSAASRRLRGRFVPAAQARWVSEAWAGRVSGRRDRCSSGCLAAVLDSAC